MNTLPPVPPLDGMDVLDVCHRHILFSLGKLAALVTRLSVHGADADARALAREVVEFFSTTVAQHHEDEERHVFPRLLASADAATRSAVLRLQTDHNWLEEDWLALSPQLAAVAGGQSWYDLDLMREQASVFTALLHDHLALEESLIYPQARAALGPAQRRDMGREMAARRRHRR